MKQTSGEQSLLKMVSSSIILKQKAYETKDMDESGGCGFGCTLALVALLGDLDRRG